MIDAASANCGDLIQKTAESLFGADTPPASILLTHTHSDHAGSSLELARMWGCPVYVHPEELPLAVGDYLPKYSNPLDRWFMEPLMRVMPRRRVASMVSKTSLEDVARAFDLDAGVPGLPDWECIPTPGHTPGHVSFFRNSDRVLIAGDAVFTVDVNSLWGFLLWSLRRSKQRVAGPIYISTWDWRAAKESVAALARLEPRVLACGHGFPMTGAATARDLRAFSDRFSGPGERQHADKEPANGLSRKDRALLLLEQEGNKRFRSLGTVLYRLTNGRSMPRNRDVLLLTTRGRTSGREHTVILQSFPDGENMVLVAANSGRTSHPDWFHNLKATPTARVEIKDQTLRVRAERLPEDEAADFWALILQRAPSYARYRKATRRTIPLVRLVPIGRATGDVRWLPLMERIKTRIEHEGDTRSVRLAAALIRLTKGRVAQLWRRQVLLLTTRGRKSGKERTVPLQFFPDGDDMIILAANSGLPSPPGWYFNLTADPLVQVEVGGRTLRVRAEEMSADEADAWWPRLLRIAPDIARYPRRTSRRIPMIRLAPEISTGSVMASRSPAEKPGGLP